MSAQQTLPSPDAGPSAEDPKADTEATSAPPARRPRGRPPKQPNSAASAVMAAGAAARAAEPTADEIRRARLERQKQERQTDANQPDASQTDAVSPDHPDASTAKQPDAEAPAAAQQTVDALANGPEATRKPRVPGGQRQALLEILSEAKANNQPLKLDAVVAALQARCDHPIIRGSIRTTLFAMKSDGLVIGQSGKWSAA